MARALFISIFVTLPTSEKDVVDNDLYPFPLVPNDTGRYCSY